MINCRKKSEEHKKEKILRMGLVRSGIIRTSTLEQSTYRAFRNNKNLTQNIKVGLTVEDLSSVL